jgi:hypothetical protein
VGYRKGDQVTANKPIFGMNVPPVPVGATGTVVKTTLLGRPKLVAFAVPTGLETARFAVEVDHGDVD